MSSRAIRISTTGYEEVLEGYDVIYEYRGRQYQLVMPYGPGEHINMRIEFAPVI